jgi:type IV secretion system protein VirB11
MAEIVIKPGEVGYERAEQWSWLNVPEFNYDWLDAMSIVSGNLMGKNFDPANPSCTTFLPDGERYTACQSPLTDQGIITINIRVPARTAPTRNYDDLFEFGERFDDLFKEADNRLDRGPSESDRRLAALHEAKDWRQFFPLAVKTRKTICAIGRMFSGKTTFLCEQLIPHIDPEDRIVTIEDTPEFQKWVKPFRNRVALYHGAGGISANDCFKICLRQRADRVLLQELRGSEILAFIWLLASGHSGSFTTWHAEETDPFTALKLMIPSGSSMTDDKIEVILRAFIDVIVHCYRDPITKNRTISSVYFRGAQ